MSRPALDIPFFRDVKETSFRIIAGTKPEQVLDAGCGAGTDLAALASILPPASRIAGLDASTALLATAAKRTAAHRDRCLLVRGDLTRIPCRIDRVLQHVHEPERVTAPGGTLVAFDNDWETLSISLTNRETSARLTRFWCDSFASGRVGRDLAGHFRDTGFTEVHAEPKTLTIVGLSLAEKVIRMLLNRMGQAGALTPAEATDVWEELMRRVQQGTFSSGYTGYLVWGTTPGVEK